MNTEQTEALAKARAALEAYEVSADHHANIYVDGEFNAHYQWWEGVEEGVMAAREYIQLLEARVAALTRERDAAREALKPFAEMWTAFELEPYDEDEGTCGQGVLLDWLTECQAYELETMCQQAAHVLANPPPADGNG